MHVLGHRTQSHLVQPYEFNYLQILKDSGYHVQYYGKNDAFSADSFNMSVTEWHGSDIGVNGGGSAYAYPESGYWSMLHTGGDVEKDDVESNGDYRAVVNANAWMKGNPPQPFMLFLSGMGAHPPYGAPREFNDKWSVDDVKQHIKLRPPYTDGKPKYHSKERGIPHYRNLTHLDGDAFHRIQASYLGMISYTDWIFGQLLKGIEAAGLENNTAVFFSSDHGDFGGDYHMVEKWPGGADDILTRVPFVARVPGGATNFVSQAPVSLMDVPHTICELAGIDVSSNGDFGINFGSSLRAQLMESQEGDLTRFVYAEGGFSPSDVFPMGSDHVPDDPTGLYYPRAQEEMSEEGTGSPRWIMMRNLTHKLVYRPKGDSELYDYASDPRELRNVFQEREYRELRESMTSSLLEWLVETSDVTPKHVDPRGPPTYPYPASACATSGAVGPELMSAGHEESLV
jgi:choline-sulfatase